MYCPHCGKEVSEEHKHCQYCGGSLQGSGKGQKNTTIGIVAVVCCLICAIVAITAIAFNSKEAEKDVATEPAAQEEAVTEENTSVAVNVVEEASVPDSQQWVDAYLWPSDRYYITVDDLRGYTQEGVAAIRNEIYARHGYVFQTDKWRNYFSQFSWYVPNANFSDSMFNDVENANIATIVDYEKSMGWRGDTAPSSSSYAAIDGYLWPTNSCYITESDLAGYSQDEVAAIRNEIYARHGYEFQTDKWRNYFSQFSWYSPNSSFSESQFSDIEEANLATIIAYEKSKGWY